MRSKIALITIVVLLSVCLKYATSQMTVGTVTTNTTATAAPANLAIPTLTSGQTAALQAINTLLLLDEESDTLVLLYINGDNDLAPYIHDLVRKVHGGAINPEITVVMVLDWPGAGNSRRYRVDGQGVTTCDFAEDYTCKGRYVLEQNVEAFPEDLGDPANLSQFIAEASAEYPDAKRVALALVGHGGGWSPNLLAGQPQGHGGKPDDELGGLLWDNYTGNGPGNSLSTLDLQQALSSAVASTGRKIDLLYLDACLMGMWEVAHEVRNEVNYLLASQSWSWTSFAYDAHLLNIRNAQSVRQIGEAWIQNEAAILRRDRYPFTHSLVDLTQAPSLTTSIDTLAQSLTAVASSAEGKTKLRTAFAASDCFDSNADHIINRNDANAGRIDNYCDLHSFAGQLQQQFINTLEIVNAAQAVQIAIAGAVVGKADGCGVPVGYSPLAWCWQALGGLSIYTPLGEDDWKRGLYTQLQVARDTHWDEFINQYWANVSAPNEPGCPPEGCPLPDGPLPLAHSVYLPVMQR